MAKFPRAAIVERLRAFLRLRSKFSDEEIESWTRDVVSRLARTRDGSVEDARSRPFVLAQAESIEVPEDVRRAPARQPSLSAATLIDRHREANGRYQPARRSIQFPHEATAAVDRPAPEVYQRVAHLIDYVTEQIRTGEPVKPKRNWKAYRTTSRSSWASTCHGNSSTPTW